MTFAGGFLRAHAGGFTVGNAAILSSDGMIDTQSFGLTYAGTITGAGQLVKAGSGALSLTAANSYAGGTALNQGTVAINNDAALGTGTLTFNGGTLQAAADGLALANAANLAGAGTIDTQARSLTYAGTVSGPGALTKVGSGTLALTGYNSYGGGTVIDAGTVQVSASYIDPATESLLAQGRRRPSTQSQVPDTVTAVKAAARSCRPWATARSP